MISVLEKFRAKIKLNNIPAYRIAQIAGIDPSTLSKLICGISTIKPDDPRVIRVGKVVGILTEECFQEETH